MKFYIAAALLAFSSVAPAQAETRKEAFMQNCLDGDEGFTKVICACVFERSSESFSDEQVLRISTLFQGSVSDAEELLAASTSKSDAQLYARFDQLTDMTAACYEVSQ